MIFVVWNLILTYLIGSGLTGDARIAGYGDLLYGQSEMDRKDLEASVQTAATSTRGTRSCHLGPKTSSSTIDHSTMCDRTCDDRLFTPKIVMPPLCCF
jgi:hypothetical protein